MYSTASKRKKINNSATSLVMHPGNYIREKVLTPINMTVTKAAEHIGISRPNVSNFLNGKVSATSEMAARIERAFGIPAQTLLDMQATYDAAQAKEKGTPSNVKAHVPPFLGIKASAIERWAASDEIIASRHRFAILLRTLVHSTGYGLTKVDFPGNDSAERPGWDGYTEADEATPWIPSGYTGWEFGTSADIKKKAEHDYTKSVKAYDKDRRQQERLNTTFIFVTPRRWAGKQAWEKAKNAENLWKEVRAYDADMLEQWLEQSLSGQVWFANETKIPAHDVRSLDKCWEDWANVASPPLIGSFFAPALDIGTSKVIDWLAKPARPFIITADSTEEALAFLAQLFCQNTNETLATTRDRIMVFDKTGILARLAEGTQKFIPVAHTRDVEREFGQYSHTMHTIAVYPRNAYGETPDIVLEPVPYEIFQKGLEAMEKNKDKIAELNLSTGRSLTVLRRQLSNTEEVNKPEWAKDAQIATSLIPFMLAGAWNCDNKDDKAAMSLLANNTPYEDLERICTKLVRMNDAPLWAIGAFRGVISKIDLLHAISGFITTEDLEHYYQIAEIVLSEDDPALDLPEENRWAAALYGKKRQFSSAFRKGIAETLVLLAVYGNNLLKRRLPINTNNKTAQLIRRLLPTPLTLRDLLKNNADLPFYAEAAPETFLSLMETDLETDAPVLFELMQPVYDPLFGSSGGQQRSSLLWALEGLAWNTDNLMRVALILARLSKVEITDNWQNKPLNSLKSIFRCWMPQTAASHEARVSVIALLFNRFPSIAWQLCIAQFGKDNDTGHYTHKPQWRNDAYGYGEPFKTWTPINQFQRVMVDMALSREAYDLTMLCDLITRFDILSEDHQKRVQALIHVWIDTGASDIDKASLREKLRVYCLSQRAARRVKKNSSTSALSYIVQEMYHALEPVNLLNKHAWLFHHAYIEPSYDETMDEEAYDYQQREVRLIKQRTDALHEIIADSGNEGIISLAKRGETAWQIGRILANQLLETAPLAALLREVLAIITAQQEEIYPLKQLVGGAVRGIPEDARDNLVRKISETLTEEEKAQLLLLCPFGRSTWEIVSTLSTSAQEAYWEHVVPSSFFNSDSEAVEAVTQLLKAQRPRAAFACVTDSPEKLDPRLLCEVLTLLAKGGEEQAEHYQLESYGIKKAFEYINGSSDISFEQKAWLEFSYVEVLAQKWDDGEHHIPNLERYIEQHPEFFVQAIVWAYKRKDDGIDPPEYRVEPDGVERCGRNGHKLLDSLRRIPGRDFHGVLKAQPLKQWIETVREACRNLSRAEVADISIGEILAFAPVGADGIWPCEPVRDVLESLHADHIVEGICTGRYNMRGVHWRGEGGEQERVLANQYRTWAQSLQYSHPYVSSKLLMHMVERYEYEADREDTDACIRRRLH